MGEPIEIAYFNWLCARVTSVNARISESLLQLLYQTEFVWSVPTDRNREADGLELRVHFLNETFRRSNDPDWYHMPCSVLEVLVAFADVASFQTDMPPEDWFSIFLRNLGLDAHRAVTPDYRQEVCDILDAFIWRTYDFNGFGGLFPLRETQNDQRKVEIWYQFCEYLNDQGLI
jgi:hypothetical protein